MRRAWPVLLALLMSSVHAKDSDCKTKDCPIVEEEKSMPDDSANLKRWVEDDQVESMEEYKSELNEKDEDDYEYGE